MSKAIVRVAEGQVQYRCAGSAAGTPLLMLHGSPASSGVLEPLIAALACNGLDVAPDKPGNDDSVPMRQPQAGKRRIP